MSDDIQKKQNLIVQMRKDNANAAFQSQQSGPPVWLISFTDVIALMLTFFVLLYSMTQPDPQKWDKKVGITTQAQAQYSGARNQAGSSEGINMSRLDYAQGENLDYIEAVLQEVMTDRDTIFVSIDKNATNVLLFFNGVTPTDDIFQDFIKRLTPTLNAMDNQMAIIVDGKKASNFVLAQDVARAIRDIGYRRNFVLELSQTARVESASFIIAIQPDDGRRITR